MKNNIKLLRLIESGFKPSTVVGLNESQINILYERVKNKKETKEAELSIDPKNPNDMQLAKDKGLVDTSGKIKIQMGEENIDSEDALGDLAMQKSTGQETPHDEKDMSPDGMDDDSDNNRGEMNEKFKSKSQQKYFFSRCNDEKLSKKERNKWCKMADEFASDTKDFSKLPEKKKKETKENYLNMISKATNKNIQNKIADIRPSLKWESVVERELERIVENNLSAKVSKKDFLSLVNEIETAPVKPKVKPTVKPGTRPSKPGSPYSPKPGPKPAPKADTKIAPSRPTVKPGTRPSKPGSPYSPKPGPKPAPKAKNNNLPEWLSFDKLGIKFK